MIASWFSFFPSQPHPPIEAPRLSNRFSDRKCSGVGVARSILLRMIQWEIWSCIPYQPCVTSLSRSIILATTQDEMARFPKRHNRVIFAPLFFRIVVAEKIDGFFLRRCGSKECYFSENGMYVRVHGDLKGLEGNMCAYLPGIQKFSKSRIHCNGDQEHEETTYRDCPHQ